MFLFFSISVFSQLSIEESGADQMPQALYGQAVITDSAGLLYTVGGTSGFHYFMDVHQLDLRQQRAQESKNLRMILACNYNSHIGIVIGNYMHYQTTFLTTYA